MPIPIGQTVFTWVHKQCHDMSTESIRLKTFYEEWANLTAGQKTGLRNRVVAKIDAVVAELADIKTAITNL